MGDGSADVRKGAVITSRVIMGNLTAHGEWPAQCCGLYCGSRQASTDDTSVVYLWLHQESILGTAGVTP